jgi:hypothetical protein
METGEIKRCAVVAVWSVRVVIDCVSLFSPYRFRCGHCCLPPALESSERIRRYHPARPAAMSIAAIDCPQFATPNPSENAAHSDAIPPSNFADGQTGDVCFTHSALPRRKASRSTLGRSGPAIGDVARPESVGEISSWQSTDEDSSAKSATCGIPRRCPTNQVPQKILQNNSGTPQTKDGHLRPATLRRGAWRPFAL